MPETVSGQSAVPIRGDSAQRLRDTVARQQEEIDQLKQAVAELAAQQAEAEPSSPRRRSRSPRRHGDTFLTVVKVVAAVAVCLTIALAAMAPRHLRQQRYSPSCNVLCSRPVAHHSRSANRG